MQWVHSKRPVNIRHCWPAFSPLSSTFLLAAYIMTATKMIFPLGELETTGTPPPPYYADEDYPAGPEILNLSPWTKQLTWLRIIHSGENVISTFGATALIVMQARWHGALTVPKPCSWIGEVKEGNKKGGVERRGWRDTPCLSHVWNAGQNTGHRTVQRQQYNTHKFCS